MARWCGKRKKKSLISICNFKQLYLRFPHPLCSLIFLPLSSVVTDAADWLNTSRERSREEGWGTNLIGRQWSCRIPAVFNCIGQSSLERKSDGGDQGNLFQQPFSGHGISHCTIKMSAYALVICNIISRNRWLQCSSVLGEGQRVCPL